MNKQNSIDDRFEKEIFPFLKRSGCWLDEKQILVGVYNSVTGNNHVTYDDFQLNELLRFFSGGWNKIRSVLYDVQKEKNYKDNPQIYHDKISNTYGVCKDMVLVKN